MESPSQNRRNGSRSARRSESRAKVSPGRGNGAPPLFLAVDDETIFIRGVIDAVSAERPELRTLVASNGAEALTVIEREEVAVLLTDLRMPTMDGFQLLSYLMSRNFRAPIIVATAMEHAPMERRMRSLPGVHFLEKPIDVDALLELLDSLLNEEAASFHRGLGAFMQLLAAERKTVFLGLRSDKRSGHLAFLEGRLVDAGAGVLEGDEAVRELLSWPNLTLEPKKGLVPQARTVASTLEDLLKSASSAVIALRQAAHLDYDEPLALSDGNSKERKTTMNVKDAIAAAMSIDGAVGAALVNHESGMTLGSDGSAIDIELAASGNTAVVRSKMAVMRSLGLNDEIEDILITLDTQYHLIRPLKRAKELFLYLAIERTRGNLGLARHQLSQIEKDLDL